MSDAQISDEPQDRLTRICDEMSKVFHDHPEHRPEDKCVVFLNNGERGGLVLVDYDDHSEAMADLLMHLRAVFQASGKRLDFMFLGEDGVDRL